MNKKIELLAPAGNLEKLKWAINWGADAVYLGGSKYSLRANAKNFTIDEIKDGVSYAHNHNAKVYVAVNIVFHNEDIDGIKEYLKELEQIKVDAIIFSDSLIMDIVNDNNIKLELHYSTQGSTFNSDAALYLKKNNVKRVVLARECSKKDIKSIIDKTGLEVECFVHGAMCVNISGRCVLSNYFTNRDANRGGCAQVCRFNFDLYDKDKNIISNDGDFSIAPKDLCLMENLKDMIDIGVSSLKLEGRMRSIYYVSTIISVYRRLIDMYLSNNIDNDYVIKASKILNRCANREVKAQFFSHKPDHNDQYYKGRKEDSNQDFLGIIIDYNENKKEATVEQRNFFKIGDKVTIFSPNGREYSFVIKYIKDEKNNLLDASRHPREIVKINCEKQVNEKDLMCVNFLD